MSKWLRSKTLWLGLNIAGLLGLLSLMLRYSPQEVGPIGVLLWFGIFYVWLLSVMIIGFCRLKKQSHILGVQLISFGLVSLVATAFVALQSLGQLQPRDTALFVVLLGIVAAYLGKLRST